MTTSFCERYARLVGQFPSLVLSTEPLKLQKAQFLFLGKYYLSDGWCHLAYLYSVLEWVLFFIFASFFYTKDL